MSGQKRLRMDEESAQIHTVLRGKKAVNALWRLSDGTTVAYSVVFRACLLMVQKLLSQQVGKCNSQQLFRITDEVLRGDLVLKEAMGKDNSFNPAVRQVSEISVSLDLSDDAKKFLKLLFQTGIETSKGISSIVYQQEKEKKKGLNEKQKADLEKILRKLGSHTSLIEKEIKLIELLVDGEIERVDAMREMRLSQSEIFFLVKRLEKEGLIVNKGEYKKRGYKIALTEKAKEILGLIEIQEVQE